MKNILSVLLAATLAACATASPDVVPRHQAQRMEVLFDATVLSVRPVTIDGSQSGLGATTGAVAGGVAGANIGGYHNSFAGSLLGAVVGGVIGNAVERGATRENGVEIVVQLRNGERRAVVQANGNESWAIGEPVVLVSSGGRTRVTRAPQVYPAPAPYPAPGMYPTPAPTDTSPQSVPVYPPSGPVPPRS